MNLSAHICTLSIITVHKNLSPLISRRNVVPMVPVFDGFKKLDGIAAERLSNDGVRRHQLFAANRFVYEGLHFVQLI